MAFTKIPDISYEINGDYIHLEQDIGCGEINSVQLHRSHVDVISKHIGLPVLDFTSAAILRKLQVVYELLQNLSAKEYFRKEIIKQCGSGIEFINELDSIELLAKVFIEDLDGAILIDKQHS